MLIRLMPRQWRICTATTHAPTILTRLKARIIYILINSCALTFASKKKLRTVKKGFHKYGYNLEVEELVKGENKVVARFEDKDLRGIKPGFRLDRAD
jgi:hypothetical protein